MTDSEQIRQLRNLASKGLDLIAKSKQIERLQSLSDKPLSTPLLWLEQEYDANLQSWELEAVNLLKITEQTTKIEELPND